jgi:hypothetical protein
METSKTSVDKEMVFDPRALRLIVGLIAFLLPFVVIIVNAKMTSSISASYHTDARDIFVGVLFVIGFLFVAYNGHHDVELTDENIGWFWQWLDTVWAGAIEFRKAERKIEERLVSLLGGVASIVAALFPTACDECSATFISSVHGYAAVILFSAVVYFCLVGFLDRVRPALCQSWKQGGKAKWRAHIYRFCGRTIMITLLASVVAPYILTVSVAREQSIVFLAETIALLLFGFAWMTASKFFWFLVDTEEEQYKPIDVKLRAARVKRQGAQTGA